MLQELARSLRQRLSLPLPGEEAHYQMAHPERRISMSRVKIPADAREGSVLILLYPDQKRIMIPLIERPVYEGVHSGQVALPGGKKEITDPTYEFTALREAQEEIGIRKKDVEILGRLTELYIPPSNFKVFPVIGMINYKPIFLPDSREVNRIIEMDLEDVMDGTKVGEKVIKLSSGFELNTPYFDIQGLTVWGATAMILSELKSVLFEIGH